MAKDKIPVTPAVRFLRARKISFTPHLYTYQDRGGAKVAARELGLDEYETIKTLVFIDHDSKPLIMLMHGGVEVSTKNLARAIKVKSLSPADPKEANRLTGYQVGGISPFGLRNAMPVYMQDSIAGLETIYINGGKRGFLVGISPGDLIRALEPTLVLAAQA
jgi:Cys-tRNA(Pro) deacylase